MENAHSSGQPRERRSWHASSGDLENLDNALVLSRSNSQRSQHSGYKIVRRQATVNEFDQSRSSQASTTSSSRPSSRRSRSDPRTPKATTFIESRETTQGKRLVQTRHKSGSKRGSRVETYWSSDEEADDDRASKPSSRFSFNRLFRKNDIPENQNVSHKSRSHRSRHRHRDYEPRSDDSVSPSPSRESPALSRRDWAYRRRDGSFDKRRDRIYDAASVSGEHPATPYATADLNQAPPLPVRRITQSPSSVARALTYSGHQPSSRQLVAPRPGHLARSHSYASGEDTTNELRDDGLLQKNNSNDPLRRPSLPQVYSQDLVLFPPSNPAARSSSGGPALARTRSDVVSSPPFNQVYSPRLGPYSSSQNDHDHGQPLPLSSRRTPPPGTRPVHYEWSASDYSDYPETSPPDDDDRPVRSRQRSGLRQSEVYSSEDREEEDRPRHRSRRRNTNEDLAYGKMYPKKPQEQIMSSKDWRDGYKWLWRLYKNDKRELGEDNDDLSEDHDSPNDDFSENNIPRSSINYSAYKQPDSHLIPEHHATSRLYPEEGIVRDKYYVNRVDPDRIYKRRGDSDFDKWFRHIEQDREAALYKYWQRENEESNQRGSKSEQRGRQERDDRHDREQSRYRSASSGTYREDRDRYSRSPDRSRARDARREVSRSRRSTEITHYRSELKPDRHGWYKLPISVIGSSDPDRVNTVRYRVLHNESSEGGRIFVQLSKLEPEIWYNTKYDPEKMYRHLEPWAEDDCDYWYKDGSKKPPTTGDKLTIQYTNREKHELMKGLYSQIVLGHEWSSNGTVEGSRDSRSGSGRTRRRVEVLESKIFSKPADRYDYLALWTVDTNAPQDCRGTGRYTVTEDRKRCTEEMGKVYNTLKEMGERM